MSVTLAHYVERTARRKPDDVAIIVDERVSTWGGLWQRIEALAGALDQFGLPRGSRVAYLGLNSEWYFETYHAPSLAGLTLAAMNFRLSVPELIDALRTSDAKILITDADHLHLAKPAAKAAGVAHLIVAGGEDPDALSYEALIAQNHRSSAAPTNGDDTVIIYFTGGTTGRSKGVELSHWNIFSNSIGIISAYKMLEGETHMLIGPMFHTAAGVRAYSCPVMGSPLIMMSRFDPDHCMALIEQYRVNVVQFVPTMIQRLLNHPTFGNYDLTSLQKVTIGAAPTTIETFRRIVDAFPHAHILNGYGMTECAPLLTSLSTQDSVYTPEKLGSAGRPVAHVTLAIRDANGHDLPTGEIGEICARGPNVMKGYLKNPEETAAVLRDGWYSTGDAGYLDEDGCLWISGRIKDMIISGGENIYPVEIEDMFSRHPDVSEVAVIGVPDPDWGEAVHAVIVRKKGSTVSEADLIAHARAHLATYKAPRGITFRNTSLPLTTANKINKVELRKWVAQQ